MSPSSTDASAGVALAEGNVSDWIAAHLDGVRAPFRFEMVANGRSNLTYLVRDASGRVLVLRRPPLGELLPTAHDVAREHRVISALRGSAVPVPSALGLCEDVAVTGAPFYLMDFVEGHVFRTVAEVEAVLSVEGRTAAADALARTLAAVHAVDLEATGLAALARPHAYVARQLKRWRGQLHRSLGGESGVGRDLGFLDAAHDVLAAATPSDSPPTLVHGDFRLGNCIVGSAGEIRAVLDWETCTLGEPLADLATLLIGWNEPGDEDLLGLVELGIVPTTAEGFPSRAEVAAAYGAVAGRDLSDLPYFLAFGWWRMACILHGVAARYRTGSGGGEAGDVDAMIRRATGATELARRALASAGLAVARS